MTERTNGLATAAEFPTLSADDQLVLESLQARGINSQPVIWSDELVRWGK
jgi:hypothetical protein